MMFQYGRFKLHSGSESLFKIECDSLTDDDLDTLARMVAVKIRFTEVHGIPRGGLRFATALRKYSVANAVTLIVDDVLTTGSSMESMRRDLGENTVGVVIFARARCAEWIHPLFQFNGEFDA